MLLSTIVFEVYVVTQSMMLIASFWVVVNHATITSALVKVCLSALTNSTCGIGALYGLAVTFGAALVAGAVVASGHLSSVTTIGSIFTSIKHTGDFFTDLINGVASLVGYDITDLSELDRTIIARTKKLHEYLTLPSSSWTGDKYQEIEAYSQDSHLMVQTNKGVGDTVTLNGLMNMINNIDDRLKSIKGELFSVSPSYTNFAIKMSKSPRYRNQTFHVDNAGWTQMKLLTVTPVREIRTTLARKAKGARNTVPLYL